MEIIILLEELFYHENISSADYCGLVVNIHSDRIEELIIYYCDFMYNRFYQNNKFEKLRYYSTR